MKKLFTYILILAMCLSVSGCSSAGGISTFTMAVEKMPTNFDPQIVTNKEDLAVITNIFDGLFEIQNGVVVNNLAESCDISRDGKTYTIKIKENSLFHCRGDKKEQFDGTAVKAKDFVFAINRILDNRTHSPYYRDFSNIEDIFDTSDYTLKITLKNPDFNFNEKLAMTAAFPCNEEFFKASGGAYGLTIDNILSNGPFRLNYLDSAGGNGTIVRADESESSLQRIRIKLVPSAEHSASYEKEEISGYFSPMSQSANYTNTSLQKFDSGNICLVFNLSDNMFKNTNIRRALGRYALGFENSGANMAAVNPVYSIFPDTVTVAGLNINESITADIPDYINRNPKDLLQQGLAETGLSKMNPVVVLMPNDSIYTLIYENINQLWQKNLGQFFSVEYLSTSEINRRVEKRDFGIAFMPLSPANNTPYGILQYFTPFDDNLKNIVNSAKSMANQREAVGYISSAQDYILETAMTAPMGSEQSVFYYRSYFENIYFDPFTKVLNLKSTTVK